MKALLRRRRYQCIYFNMEMSKATIYRRIISITADIPIDDVIHPKTEYQKGLIEKAMKEVEQAGLIVEHKASDIKEIKSIMMKVKDKNRHTVLFIDHLGLTKCDNHNYRKYDDREYDIEIIRGSSSLVDDVKKLAKLSRLEFTEEETQQFVKELEATLKQVEAINKVDVSGVDLLESTIDADTQLRPDVVVDSLPVEQIVLNAPDKKDGAFLVPITVAED